MDLLGINLTQITETLLPPIINHTDEINLASEYRPEYVAFDVEGTGLKWSKPDIRPYSLGMVWRCPIDSILKKAYLEWPVDPKTRLVQYGDNLYKSNPGLEKAAAFLGDEGIIKLASNLKYDWHMIDEAWGIPIKGPKHDTINAAWCCRTNERAYKQRVLTKKYLGRDRADEDILKEKAKKAHKRLKDDGYKQGSSYHTDYWAVRFYDHSSRDSEIYNIQDCIDCLELYEGFEELLTTYDLWEVYDIEMEILEILFHMEKRGIRFHQEKAINKIDTLTVEGEEQEKYLRERFNDKSLNVNSNKQLARYFFDWAPKGKPKADASLKIPVKRWTEKAREPYMGAPVLMNYKDEYPEVDARLKYNGVNKGKKMLQDYNRSCIPDIYCTTSDLLFLSGVRRICPNFNQIAVQLDDSKNGTRTGRLSSSDPNLQNVTDEMKSSGVYVVDGREYFGPREGYVLIFIDYSQLELRIFAERIPNSTLYDAFKTDGDPHDATRRAVPYLAEMDEKKGRKLAKNTNFSVVNTGGAQVLKKKYNIPLSEGQAIFNDLHKNIPQIRQRQAEAEQQAIDHPRKCVVTLTGRTINLDTERYTAKQAGDKGKPYLTGKYKYTYRATAYDIQGSAADIIKRAMIECNKYLKNLREEDQIDAHLLLQVHDELVFEIKEDDYETWIVQELIYIMEHVADKFMTLPLKCEANISKTTWSSKDQEEIKL